MENSHQETYIVNFEEFRNHLKKTIREEKKAGNKKIFLFTHIQLNQWQIMDTNEEYKEQVDFYEKQGITLSKTIDKNEVAKSFGASGCRLHVFRKEGGTLQRCVNRKGEFVIDSVSCAFGYMPADCEFTIAEIFLTSK